MNISRDCSNEYLDKIIQIIYSPFSNPLDVSMYDVVKIENYPRPPWDQDDPKVVPIFLVPLSS